MTWQPLALTLSLLISSTAYGQTRERWAFSLDGLSRTQGTDVSFFEIQGNTRWPIDDEGSSLLSFGIQYRKLSLSWSGRDQSFDLTVPQAAWLKVLNETDSLVLTARPGFFSAPEELTTQSFRLEGGAIWLRVLSESLTWGLGFGRGSNFGRDVTIPVMQVIYFPTNTVMIDALLPVKIEAWYLPSKTWELGALFNIVGSLYRFTDSQLGSDQMGFGQMNLSFGARRWLLDSYYALAEIGTTVARRFEFANSGTLIQDRDLPNTLFLRFSLTQRF